MPKRIAKIMIILNKSNFSFRKIVLKINAKIIEVSLKEETIAIGR